MYRAATTEDLLRFGDIVEAEWIFDLCLRDDAKPLTQHILPGGRPAIVAEQRSAMTKERVYPKDAVLAHANVDRNANRAVIISDDCDVEDARRINRGRLRLAALVALPANQDERAKALATQAFDRYPLQPQEDLTPPFAGGTIELQRVFSVAAAEVLALKPVLVIADEQRRQELQIRWAAHATRHGPAVAAQSAQDLVKLLIADGDVEAVPDPRQGLVFDAADHEMIERLKIVSVLNWALEGGNVDSISDALEEGDAPDVHLERTAQLLDRLATASADAAASVRQSITRRGRRG